jgi:hypothetical protein
MAVNLNPYGGDDFDATEQEQNLQIYTPGTHEMETTNMQWRMYTRARDAGHLDYVRDARKYDDFYVGEQWEDSVVQVLDQQKRPHHTVNLVLSTVNAVVGEYIRSRQDIAFVPQGKGASQDTAKSLRFLFKQIALNNNSEYREREIFLDGLVQDRGYFYYYMDFSDSVEGELREMQLDPTDVILDAGAKEYDPETWSEVFISRWLTPEEIGALYGTEFVNIVDLAAANGTFGHDSLEWEAPNFSGNHYNSEVFFEADRENVKRVKRIRVIERQYRKLTRTGFFVDVVTGDMRRIPEGWDTDRVAEFLETHAGQIDVMWKPERRIRRTITADRVLLSDEWSLFDRFSIVPFFPYFRRGRPFGLVRNLISPQEMLNKVTSQELHVVNTTANSGWMFKTGSLINMDADDLSQEGSKTGLVLEWQGDVPPEKIQANSIPTGLDQISAKAGVYFREISGVNEAMLGAGRSDSSKALESRRQGGLVQQEIIFDNLDYTRKLRAAFILEAVQRYYTETRLLTIFERNADGDDVEQQMEINQPVSIFDPETSQTVDEIMNDLTIGEYEVAISSVPRRDTYDESLFDQLISMREAGVQIPDHTLIENSQLPDRKEVADEVKQIQGLAAPSPEEVERMQAIDDLQMRLLNAQVMNEEAQAMERQARAMQLQADAQAKIAEPQNKQLEIGTKARVEMEKQASEERSNMADLAARIELMRMKNSSGERVATVQSATKRMEGALSRQSSLEQALINVRSKQNDGSSQAKAS